MGSRTGGKFPPPSGDSNYGGENLSLPEECEGTGTGQPDITPRTGAGGVGSSGSKSDSNSK